LNLTKPATTSGIGPAAALSPPRTDFDVDLHDPKPKETYDAISKIHYGDTKFGPALRAFNNGAELGQVVTIQVPPIYVLRKKYPQLVSRSASPATTPPVGNERGGLEWSTPTVK